MACMVQKSHFYSLISTAKIWADFELSGAGFVIWIALPG
jgi:hypothetical protein